MDVNRKVLIVDDEQQVLKWLQTSLKRESAPYDVLLADSGEKALEILSREQRICVVISDVIMPGMTGLELLTKIRKHYPSIKVVLMTGYTSSGIRREMEKSGCLQFFQKPFDVKELRTLIIREINERDRDSGFCGTLKNIQLVDLIQMCCMAGINTSIGVYQDVRNGTIYIRDGRISHAVCGDMEGETAFYEIIAWRSGSFETLGEKVVPPVTIEKGWEQLLLEGVRRLDEARHEKPLNGTESEPVIRILIVDDSPLICNALKKMLSTDPSIRIIGTAGNGEQALEKIGTLKPDLITLDVNMPVMDGKSTIKHIMIKSPCPILIVSSVSSSSGQNILDFLRLGAVDFIHKPVKMEDWKIQRDRLVQRIKLAAQADVRKFKIPKAVAPVSRKIDTSDGFRPCRMLTIINSGPGGYGELINLVTAISGLQGLCVIALQSMPGIFMPALAEYLSQRSSARILPVGENMPIAGNRCYIGTDELNMTLKEIDGRYQVARQEDDISQQKQAYGFDRLIASIADMFLEPVLVVMLSGAQAGSFEGMKRLDRTRTIKIAQSIETCMVPGPLIRAMKEDVIDHEMTTDEIGQYISDYISNGIKNGIEY